MTSEQPGAVCVVHRGSNVMELTQTLVEMFGFGQVPRGTLFLPVEGSSIAKQRNVAIREALSARPNLGWVFFIDSDESQAATALRRLLAIDRPIVSGVVLQRQWGYQVPAFWSTDPVERVRWSEVPVKGVLGLDRPLAACGSGCLLIRREAIDVVGDPWFRCGQIEVDQQQEDIDFTMRAAQKGLTPVLVGDVRPHHQITGWVYLGADGRPWIRPSATFDVAYPLDIREGERA